MTAETDEAIAGAIAQLQEDGELVTFTPTESGDVYDPATGGTTGGTTGTPVTAYAYPSGYKNNEQNGDTVKAGDIRLVTQKMTTRPIVGWTVVVDTVTYRVMDVKPIRQSGVDIIYICQLRK